MSTSEVQEILIKLARIETLLGEREKNCERHQKWMLELDKKQKEMELRETERMGRIKGAVTLGSFLGAVVGWLTALLFNVFSFKH